MQKFAPIAEAALKTTPLRSDAEVLEELKQSKLPLVLWGAAKCAQKFSRLLARNDIPIAALFTDVPVTDNPPNGKDVFNFEEICSVHRKFNILIAHGYHELASKYRGHPQVAGVYILSDINGFGMHYSTAFLQENAMILDELYENLADITSRESLLAYVTARASNNWEHTRPFLSADEYFPDFMSFKSGEILVDCGAYTGDTLMRYVYRTSGLFERYYALEPSPQNLKELRGVVACNNLQNVHIVPVGAWDKRERLPFVQDGDQSHALAMGHPGATCFIDLDTIDNICAARATYIKMDIEGAELRALLGAAGTIQRNRPKLAVCVYHRTQDLVTIPQIIKRLSPDYRLYFRLHDHLGMGAVLYAL